MIPESVSIWILDLEVILDWILPTRWLLEATHQNLLWKISILFRYNGTIFHWIRALRTEYWIPTVKSEIHNRQILDVATLLSLPYRYFFFAVEFCNNFWNVRWLSFVVLYLGVKHTFAIEHISTKAFPQKKIL